MIQGSTFKQLKPLGKTEYLILLALSVSIPVSWNLSIWLLLLLTLNSLLRITLERKADREKRWLFIPEMILCIAFSLVYLASMLYTQNQEEGWHCLERKIPFLLLGLFFMWNQHKYFGIKQLRTCLYLFSATLLVLFFVRLGIAFKNYFTINHTLTYFFNDYFIPTHHSYMSMYILLGLVFFWSEIFYSKAITTSWIKKLLPLGTLILVVFLMLIQSKAGILCFVSLLLFWFIYYTFIQKHFKRGFLTFLLGVVIVGGTLYLIPPQYNRLEITAKKILSGEKSDSRFYITHASLEAAKENFWIGAGAGDRIDVLREQYDLMGNSQIILKQFNPHNQFLDTLITTGIIGFLVLLSIFAVPLIRAMKSKDHMMILFLYIVFFSALFESVFERQMGIDFFVLFLGLMITSRQHTSSLPDPQTNS